MLSTAPGDGTASHLEWAERVGVRRVAGTG